MAEQKQLEGKNLKGRELATSLRTQARKMLPEYDEAMGLKGKGKDLTLPQIIALQTLTELRGPNSIQFIIEGLRNKTPKTQAQELLSLIQEGSVSAEFLVRMLRVAAIETRADAAMCEERAGHYLNIASEIKKADKTLQNKR